MNSSVRLTIALTLCAFTYSCTSANAGTFVAEPANMPLQARLALQAPNTQEAIRAAQASGCCNKQLQAVVDASRDSQATANSVCGFIRNLFVAVDQLVMCEGGPGIGDPTVYECNPNASPYDASYYQP